MNGLTVMSAWMIIIIAFVAAEPAAGVASAERVDQQTQAALLMDAHPDSGRQLFGRVCATCHGRDAFGDAQRGVPSLAGQRYAYVVRQLANFAGSERDNAIMHGVVARPPIKNPQSWADIAAYVNALTSATSSHTAGPGIDLALGHRTFQAHCASCHGADAEGDDDGFAPSLRRQHYGYLIAQMHKLADGHRHNVDVDLVHLLRGFDDRDMRAMADYLSRLRGSPVGRKRMRDDGTVVD